MGYTDFTPRCMVMTSTPYRPSPIMDIRAVDGGYLHFGGDDVLPAPDPGEDLSEAASFNPLHGHLHCDTMMVDSTSTNPWGDLLRLRWHQLKYDHRIDVMEGKKVLRSLWSGPKPKSCE